MENHYPYKKVWDEDTEETAREWGHWDTIYEFKSKDGKTYSMCIYYYDHDKSISFDWAEKSDFWKKYHGEIHKYEVKTKWNELNINEIERILTTVFKILLDYLDQYEVDLVSIGSFARYKYKAYKSIVKSMPEFEITEDKIIPKDKKGEWPQEDYYSLYFKKIK